MFDPKVPVARASGAAYQFVQLRPQGCSVAVLGVLDHEYHQEGDNGGRGIYYKLPSIGELEYRRSEEHTSELQSLMRISYAVFCMKKKKLSTPSTSDNIIHN